MFVCFFLFLECISACRTPSGTRTVFLLSGTEFVKKHVQSCRYWDFGKGTRVCGQWTGAPVVFLFQVPRVEETSVWPWWHLSHSAQHFWQWQNWSPACFFASPCPSRLTACMFPILASHWAHHIHRKSHEQQQDAGTCSHHEQRTYEQSNVLFTDPVEIYTNWI